MREFYKKNKENIDKTIIYFVFIVGIFLFVKYVAIYFAPFIFGYIMSLFLFPVARFLQDKLKMTKTLSTMLTMLVLALFVGTVVWLVANKIIYEARVFINNLPAYTQELLAIVEGLRGFLDDKLGLMPQWFKEQINNNMDKLIGILTSKISSGIKTSPVSMVKGVVNFVMIIIFGLISCFFIVKDRREIDGFIYRQMPEAIHRRFRVIKTGLIDAVGGYIRAQLIMMLIIGSICVIGLSVLGSPYAFLLALVIAVVDALPVFGSGAIFWPWAIYSALLGDIRKAVFIIVINIIVLLTRQLFEPKILGGQIGLHPLVTLTSIYCGLRLFGVIGIIIGPMLVLVTKAMQEAELLPKWK